MATRTGKVLKAEYTRSYTGRNGQTFVFALEIEEETAGGGKVVISGDYSSLSNPQTKFPIGSIVAFEVVESTNQYPDKIKPVKSDAPYSGNRGGNKSYEKPFDPKENHRIDLQVAYEAALKLLSFADKSKLKKGIDVTFTKVFTEWLDEVSTDKNRSYMASNALRRAVECLAYPVLMDETVPNMYNRVLLKAQEIFEFYLNN